METSLFEYFILPIAFLTSALSGTIGMGGGVVLVSLMTFFLNWKNLIPIHGVVQLVSNSSRAFLLREHIAWFLFFPFLVGAPFGALFAFYAIKEVSDPKVALGLIVVLIFYTLFKPKKLPALHVPHWGFAVLGLISGFLGVLVGATGPFLAPFFLRKDLEKKQVVATKAFCQMVTHISKVPVFWAIGFDYGGRWLLIFTLCCAAVLGTKLGVHILHRLPEKVFVTLYKGALLVAALRLLWKIGEF